MTICSTYLRIFITIFICLLIIKCSNISPSFEPVESYVVSSKHSGIGERYINNRDSVILDLTFPVRVGLVPDSIKSFIPFYKLLDMGAEKQENQFYWYFSNRWFLNASIYSDEDISSLHGKIIKQYESQYANVSYKLSSYEVVKGENAYLLGSLEGKKYSFWEFFYKTKNNKIFRMSLVGIYPEISEKYAEDNGKSQIKNLLSSDKNKFLFSPEQTLLDHYLKNNFDPIKTINYFDTVKDGLSESDYRQIHQILSFLYSSVNDFTKLNYHMSAHFSADSTGLSAQYLKELIKAKEEVSYVPAKNEILSSLKNKNFLVINENHNYPRCRIFLKSLLVELYKMGYKTLVAEGIGNNSLQDYRQLIDVKKGNGFYVNESEFSNLLREAKDIGFNLFSYSPKVQNLQKFNDKTQKEEYRDSIMFENIKAIYNDQMNQKGKMIIFCGHDHVVKSKNPDRKVLGQYINDWKGVEALFVDQSRPPEFFDFIKIEDIFSRINFDEPVVPKYNSADFLGGFKNMFDKFILFTPTKTIVGVPDWSVENGEQTININFKTKEKGRHYVSIYVQNEVEAFGFEKAVPYKIIPFDIEINMDIKVDELRYVMVVFDNKGQKIYTEDL